MVTDEWVATAAHRSTDDTGSPLAPRSVAMRRARSLSPTIYCPSLEVESCVRRWRQQEEPQ